MFFFFKVRSESESCLFSFRHDKAHFLSLFLFISSSSFPLTRVPSTTNLTPLLPVYLSLFVCLFVNTVQTLRPCKLPPTFTACLLLFSHLWPTYNLPTPPSPTPVEKKLQSFCVLGKRDFSQVSFLNQWNSGIRHCTLHCETAAKKKGNEIKPKDLSFFSLASTLFLCGVLSENGNKCCDQLTFGGSVK